MAKEAFEAFTPAPASALRIEQANQIILEYQRQGFTLTLRQLYYQFVARGLLENRQANYKGLGALLSRARLAGLVDWTAMEDRTRNLEGGSWGYADVPDFISYLSRQYQIDIWDGQETYLEVWVEKEALAGVVQKAVENYRVAYLCCRGNVSQSEMYEAGKRMAMQSANGRSCHVFHLGDHDPNGMDMTRDNADRLAMFSDGAVEFHRIALNMDQIEELKPPPNPAKETDSRYASYVRQYGDLSWELDALSPAYIDRLVNRNLERYIDLDTMNARRAEEEQGRQNLERVSTNWEAIEEFLDEITED
jgi:hypothetical protein